MNLKSLSLSLFLAIPALTFAIDQEEVFNLGLNVLVFDTENGEEPSCEYVSAPEGCLGKGITNAIKVPGSLKIYSGDGELLYDSGDYEKGESGMTIKIRGNTSAYASKKPYKIKLQKKSDLLLRGDKAYNDKNWVLLNDNQLKLVTGFEISRLLEEDWTPEGMYVNVILNNDYRGMYYLVESIDRNEKSRINVSEEGFIVEHDAYWWNEDGAYILSEFNPSLNFTFKYPDFEEVSENNLKKISDILSEYEVSLKDETYPSAIDIESFAKWILGHDILGTWDGGGANLYLSKYDLSLESKLKAGPLWDFDTIEINEGNWSGVHMAFNRFDSFFKSDETPFMKVYLDLWRKKGKTIYEGIKSLIRDFKDEEKWESYRLSSEATSSIWGPSINPAEIALREEEWFESRFDWLRQQLGDYDEEPLEDAGVNIIEDNASSPFKDVYNLQGVKVLSKATKEEIRQLRPGIYVIGNKKVLIK